MAAGVEVRTAAMGEDIVFMVTGGSAHIGASSTARLLEDGAVRTETYELPGHREGPLADKLAAMAAKALGRTAVVVIGIHLDNPTHDEIEAVVEEAQSAMKETVQGMLEERSAGA